MVANLKGRQYSSPPKTLTFLDANLKGFTVLYIFTLCFGVKAIYVINMGLTINMLYKSQI